MSWIKGSGSKADNKESAVIAGHFSVPRASAAMCMRYSGLGSILYTYVRLMGKVPCLFSVLGSVQPPPLPSDVQFDILRKKKWRCNPDALPTACFCEAYVYPIQRYAALA